MAGRRGGGSGSSGRGGRGGTGGRTRFRLIPGGRRRGADGFKVPDLAADAPCPCGSGARFGACCREKPARLAAGIRDRARSWRSFVHKVRTFALELLGGPPEPAAWEDLCALVDWSPSRFAGFDDLFGRALLSWLGTWSLSWWIPWDEEEAREKVGWSRATLADEFAARHRGELRAREREYLDAALGCPFSMHRVVARAPGLVFTRDLLLGERHVLVDPEMPRSIDDGMVVYGAIGRLPFGSALLANGPAVRVAAGVDLAGTVRELFRMHGRPIDRRTLRLEWRPAAMTWLLVLERARKVAAGGGTGALGGAGGWN